MASQASNDVIGVVIKKNKEIGVGGCSLSLPPSTQQTTNRSGNVP